MHLLCFSRSSLLLLDFVHQLADFGLETLLEFFFQLSVLLEFLRSRCDRELQLDPRGLTLLDEGLVLGDVLLQVVEDEQFLVESNQSVKLVLKFDLLFLQLQL